MKNDMIYTVSMRRIDLVNVMTCMTSMQNLFKGEKKEKFRRLHDIIKAAVEEQDKLNDEEEAE